MAATTDTKPFAPFEWLLASRYLRSRRKEGFVSVIAAISFLGIMLGVATLIIVMAVMNGFRKDLFAKILGLNGHIIVSQIGGQGGIENYPGITEAILRAQGVVRAMPLVEGPVMVTWRGGAMAAGVRGLSETDLKSMPLVAGNIRYGTLDGFDESRGIAIGTRLANMLNVNIGSELTIVTPRGASTPVGIVPRSKAYPVVAIFELGMAEFDKSTILMPLGEAQRYFAAGNAVDMIEVILQDPEAVDLVSARIRGEVGPTVYVSDWRQRNETFFTVLEVERNVMFIILSLIVLVAALNIISGLMMLVKDKGRDIAVLRTMGATKGAVMRVFLITGASIGVVGTIAGCIIGIVFCIYIEEIRQFVAWVSGTAVFDPTVYYLTRLPADINPTETASIALMALALSVLATLYPSWRASRMDPVEALRYE
ncbi:lipoprotein-releasing ABC transporter permease subunit [uncultured Hyphomicrobium sp.]|uniref:lipoprotein-releasing ABC transporter permease subunit n=1 Tax=uncultured Hyphomicrobium sp. TaxID=194373 RepID=UPI0025FC77CE|nr:lipoprotein-releasing ABC transporter permease subunit [uncultured Hyphomicrobium sp.]